MIATAEDGAKGFELIMRHKPDTALLDIGLPKLNGYQLARKLREELGSDIPLIALTGYGREEDHEAVLEAGFNKHLVKPIRIKQLTAALGSEAAPP